VFPLGLSTKALCALILFSIRATSPTSLDLLDLSTRIMYGEEYSKKLLIVNFSPVAVNSSLLGLIIFLSSSNLVNYYYYYYYYYTYYYYNYLLLT
jgi:hypothetical protein